MPGSPRRGTGIVRTALWLAVVATVVVVGALLWVGWGGDARGTSVRGHGSSWTPAARASSFSIAGSVSGLYPGRTLPLVLKVINPFPMSISLTSITTSVQSVSTDCPATNVVVSRFSGHHHVAARGSDTVLVYATMARAAPDTCQGSRFLFTYGGQATEE